MNRREFLYTGAAAAAVVTRSMDARAYSAIAGANERVGLGVIGLGRRATVRLRLPSCRIPASEFRALADIYDKQVAAFQGRFKDHVANAEVSVEYQKMLERKDIDAVLRCHSRSPARRDRQGHALEPNKNTIS